jgi:lysosomal acid lipase/cholesteryl ester hydrolase
MLIRSKGYPCEEHDVVTDDGYILSVQRIPHGINGAKSSKWALKIKRYE